MDNLFAIGAAGAMSYLVFKKTETIRTTNLFVLLVLVPLLVTTSSSTFNSIGLVTSFLGYYTTIILCTALYRLSPWHPLAHYPGPLICKITKFKAAFVSSRGKQYQRYQRLHEEYGDIVRIGPNELSFLNIEAINPILGPNGAPRGPFWDGRVPESLTVHPIGALRDVEEHRRRRIPWSKAFSSAALKEYAVLVKAKTAVLAEQLASVAREEDGVVELGKWLGYYTYDVMTDFAFSGGSDMLHEGDPQGLWAEMRGGLERTMFMSHVPWLGRLCYRLPAWFFRGLNGFRKASAERAIKRMAEGSDKKDLYYYLLDEGNPHAKSHEGMDKARVISDGSSAVLAGSDTTSATTTLICYYLVTHPNVHGRLKQEIDGAGDRLDDPSVQAKMTYLNGVMYMFDFSRSSGPALMTPPLSHEVLRLWPAVLNGSPRGISADNTGKVIAGCYVPPGTNLTIPFYSVQRDPRNFSPYPEEFIPERWLPQEERVRFEPVIFTNIEEYKNDPQAFVAFSAGPANCVGKNLAMMEMRMVLCTLLKRFNIELVGEKERFEDTVMDYYTMQVGKLWVRLTARNV
ncbi:hypothetical protein V5O48_002436 [Marasmius crinis-equi]|uniref:Cytochrome P450 n=1 Tax=Marasmius crinis-equi TaxID=585013 RepID=A0ABR3FWP0_9AGAR